MPGVAAICVGLEGDQFKRRPPLSINQILAQPGAVDIAEQTLMELIQADQSK
jgi:hypothetical protein